MGTISFKHSGNSGDIIYSLSGIKAVCEKYDMKADIYLWLNRPAHYYEGAVHPVKDDKTVKKNVMLNQYMFDMLKPLLESQKYIHSVQPWNGEEIQVDLDTIRKTLIGIPNGDIRRWYHYKFHDMISDTSFPSLIIPYNEVSALKKFSPFIIVNRTERYRNNAISYAFLKNCGVQILFVGTVGEFELFKEEVPNSIHYLPKDFLELAFAMLDAICFIGNQSMCFAIAEQMKIPRILEVCEYAPNVIVSGYNGYDYYSQDAFKYYTDHLIKEYNK